MRTPRAALLVGLLGAVCGPLRAQGNGVFPGDPTAGQRIFEERGCVHCHSIWGNGGTLGPDFAVVAASGHRAARRERVVADDLRADEAPRDVAVNLARGQLRRTLSRHPEER